MKINIVKLKDEEIEKIAEIDTEKEVDYMEIPLEEIKYMEEYKEHKRKRNAREFKKFGVEYERD